MTYFVRISEDGAVSAFVDLPDGFDPAEATGETGWREAPSRPALGWNVDGDSFKAPPPPAIDLAALKMSLKAAIDDGAERERLKYITAGAGQAMTYARKVEEAKTVIAAADPQPNDYPMLAASIGIDGPDLAAVAITVLAMDAAWAQIGGAIEAARLTAKRDIDQAENEAAARAVTPFWPST